MTNQSPPLDPDQTVTILMGVRNGAAHLRVQLDSIAAQHHQNWKLLCSDDGSTDGSALILREFAHAQPGKVSIIPGPAQGFSRNYMSMIAALPPDPGVVCFADQDDLWLPEKITVALSRLAHAATHPVLYCGRRSYWYPDTYHSVWSSECRRPFTLRNALIENVASGNTIVLNPAAAALARLAARRTGDVFAHDWWLYLLITACGGSVIHDNGPPMLLYRQHHGNAIGAGQGLRMQWQRKIGVLQGLYATRLAGNIAALEAVGDLLTSDAQTILSDFCRARKSAGLARLAGLRRVGPYRQHWTGSLGFWGAASLGRI